MRTDQLRVARRVLPDCRRVFPRFLRILVELPVFRDDVPALRFNVDGAVGDLLDIFAGIEVEFSEGLDPSRLPSLS